MRGLLFKKSNMSFALTATVFSSICMAVMVVADKLMLNECYENKPRQAWFISSFAGSTFGLSLTIGAWCLIASLSTHGTLAMILAASLSLFYWQGIAVMIAGALGIQVLFYYFRCFNEDASSASVAAWIAATPIFILLFQFILGMFVYAFGFESASTLLNNSKVPFFVGTIIATIGLISFEYISNGHVKNTAQQRKDLILMITCNVLYTVLLQYVLGIGSNIYTQEMYTLALLPYLWFGFAIGTRDILNFKLRQEIILNWQLVVKKYWRLILLAEFIGMFVFYFEYFGLSELNAAYVSVVISSHVIVVYLLDKLLVVYLKKNPTYTPPTNTTQRLNIDANLLLKAQKNNAKYVLEIGALVTAIIGIIIATIFIV